MQSPYKYCDSARVGWDGLRVRALALALRNRKVKGGGQPKFFGNLDFELVVGPSGPTYGQTFLGVFEVPDPPAPAWCHAQI